jgi:hypothetical protein
MEEQKKGELEEADHKSQEKQPADDSVCHQPDDNKDSLFLVGTNKITYQQLLRTRKFWGWFQVESNRYCHYARVTL